MVIDGTTHDSGTPGVKGVELDGSLDGDPGPAGFQINAGSGTIVRGLAINSFDPGFGVIVNTADTTLESNYIGTNAAGTAIDGNEEGVHINGGGSSATVGGATPAQGNVISGNGNLGVLAAATGGVIQNNYIGTDLTGLVDLGNNQSSGTSAVLALMNGNQILDNVISGNNGSGIELLSNTANLNTIAGNTIGLGADGSTLLGNANDGVAIGLGASGNVVGGTGPGDRNVISGNARGIFIEGNGIDVATGNSVVGNFIGTDAAGTAAKGNGSHGVVVSSRTDATVVGGTGAADGNVISGNAVNAIVVGVDGGATTIQGNYIGVDATGSAALGNGAEGMLLSGTAGTVLIGGTAAGATNVISGNGGTGIYSGAGGLVPTIQGNLVGPDASGTADIGNGVAGLWLGSDTAVVGGSAAGAANVIAGNAGPGITSDELTAAIQISGNAIRDNTGLGIDLNNDGVTLNDAGDADSGPNDLQNFPVLNSGSSAGGTHDDRGRAALRAEHDLHRRGLPQRRMRPHGPRRGWSYRGFRNGHHERIR